MDGSPSSVLTAGLGAWGSPSLLVTLGFGQGAVSVAAVCGDATLLPTYKARVAALSKYNATINLLPTYKGIVEAKEC